MKEIYVLRRKSSLTFFCHASTLDELKTKVDRCYWNARGIQSKGSDYSKETYLKDKTLSKIILEDIPTSQLSDNNRLCGH